jgi:uridine kinase
MKTKPMIIGIAGGSGSGKTTVANAIREELNGLEVAIIHHDAYYKDHNDLPLCQREKINYDHPDALETDLLAAHLKTLLEGKNVEIPQYDFTLHCRKAEGLPVNPARVILLDGILILAEPSLRELMDVKIFVDTDHDIRFIRRLKRDIHERGRSMDSVIQQYMDTVRPMHLAFVEPSRRYADIILPEGHKPISTRMVVALIRDRIQEEMAECKDKE